MGKIKVSSILYEVANLLCVAAECISRGYVPPAPMGNSEWEKVKARVRAQQGSCPLAEEPELPYKPPRDTLIWHSIDSMDIECVLIEIETCDDFPVRYPHAHAETRWRWRCHDCDQHGPPLMGPDTYRGTVAHLVAAHPNERWPEGMTKPG